MNYNIRDMMREPIVITIQKRNGRLAKYLCPPLKTIAPYKSNEECELCHNRITSTHITNSKQKKIKPISNVVV